MCFFLFQNKKDFLAEFEVYTMTEKKVEFLRVHVLPVIVPKITLIF